MTNVVVFCGGRGSSTIIRSLAERADVDLSVVVNAYDAGLSTGRVRRAVPGLLGPSDVRKNVSTLATAAGDAGAALCAQVMEYRLPVDGDEAAEVFAPLLADTAPEGDVALYELVRALPNPTWRTIRSALAAFADHLDREGLDFDFSDLAIGNAALGGFFLLTGDFDGAIRSYSAVFGFTRHRVVNVTRGEDLWLSARAGDSYCPDEGVLVAQMPPAPIEDILLLGRAEHDAVYPQPGRWIGADELNARPEPLEVLPALGDDAAAAIADADVIVYGPGTQHSSLLPSYLTRGLAEALVENRSATKLLFLNAGHDLDQHPSERQADYVAKLHTFLTRRGEIELPLRSLVSEVVAGPESAEHLADLDGEVGISTGIWITPAGRHLGDAATRKILGAARHARELDVDMPVVA